MTRFLLGFIAGLVVAILLFGEFMEPLSGD